MTDMEFTPGIRKPTVDEIPETVVGEQIDCMHRTSNHQPRFAAAS